MALLLLSAQLGRERQLGRVLGLVALGITWAGIPVLDGEGQAGLEMYQSAV